MKVPNDFADMGGDMGPGVLGLVGSLGEGKLSEENRCGRCGGVVRGGLGMPWVDRGRRAVDLLAAREPGWFSGDGTDKVAMLFTGQARLNWLRVLSSSMLRVTQALQIPAPSEGGTYKCGEETGKQDTRSKRSIG